MTEPLSVTIQAYPAGSEHWVCDAGEVRRVRVTDVAFSSRRPDLSGQVIHSIEPVAPAKAGDDYDMRAPGPYLSIAEFEVKPGHEAEFAAATGTEAKEERPPTHLTLNEWQSPDAFETAEFKDAAQTPGLAKIRETGVVEGRRRLFKFARSWDRV